jgi:tRNA-Thr(GGU) m(6)t(6)A37 methyltransferase TsaA
VGPAPEEVDVSEGRIELEPIGRVRSVLVEPGVAPKQADEGAPEAWLDLDPRVREAMQDLRVGSEVVVLTWLHLARRDVTTVHPRDDPANPSTGVFSTRSQDRPNPIGLHTVHIAEIVDTSIRVRSLEAVDGTPVLDIKPLLGPVGSR